MFCNEYGGKEIPSINPQGKRQNEDAYVIVTGCYAQLDPDAIAAIDGVNLVIGTNNRSKNCWISRAIRIYRTTN